jgi:hypothetical protein
MREALAPTFARRGNRSEIERLRAALLGDGRRLGDELVWRVLRYVAEHPGASGRTVAFAVGGRYADVRSILATVRGTVRGRSQRVPEASAAIEEDSAR